MSPSIPATRRDKRRNSSLTGRPCRTAAQFSTSAQERVLFFPIFRRKSAAHGLVVGVDFSRGMLKASQAKTASLPNVHLVEADAGHLPFRAGAFDAVTCSHAFYELKGETRDRALQEILRVLRPKGTFLMMEHDVPSNLIVRTLFYLRLTIIGAGRAITFLRHEREVLERYFQSVEKTGPPTGRSKILICWK